MSVDLSREYKVVTTVRGRKTNAITVRGKSADEVRRYMSRLVGEMFGGAHTLLKFRITQVR